LHVGKSVIINNFRKADSEIIFPDLPENIFEKSENSPPEVDGF